MNNMFKKTLLAASIALVSTGAFAGDTSAILTVYSSEGLSLSTDTVKTAPTVNYKFLSDYAINDRITFTFTEGSIASTNVFPSTLAGELSGKVFSKINETTNSVTYRLTADGTSLVGVTATLADVKLKPSAIAAGTVSVTVKSVTSDGTVFDSNSSAAAAAFAGTDDDAGNITGATSATAAGSLTAKLALATTQFGKLVVDAGNGFDAVIDVNNNRKQFTSATASTPVATDVLTFSVAVPTVEPTEDLILADLVHTFTVKADLPGFKSANIVSTGNTVAYDDAKKAFTIKSTAAPSGNVVVTVTPPIDTDAVVLNPQAFEVLGEVAYGTGKTASLVKAAAGQWTINGAVVNVPYLPFGDTITQVLYVTNEGSLTADITAIAVTEAGTKLNLGNVGTVTKGSVKAVAGAVKTALAAQGFTSGKASITLTVNAPAKDISVYGAYNVGGNSRVTVLNSQYKDGSAN